LRSIVTTTSIFTFTWSSNFLQNYFYFYLSKNIPKYLYFYLSTNVNHFLQHCLYNSNSYLSHKDLGHTAVPRIDVKNVFFTFFIQGTFWRF